jgi:hypothetical protein
MIVVWVKNRLTGKKWHNICSLKAFRRAGDDMDRKN